MSTAIGATLQWLGCPRGIDGVHHIVAVEGSNLVDIAVEQHESEPPAVDVVVLCGSAVLSNIHDAFVLATRDSSRPWSILVTGGVGHSTSHLIDAMTTSLAAPHRERWLPNWSRFAAKYALCDADDVDVRKRLLNLGRSEASWIAEILTLCFDFPHERLWLEEQSTNCGANAERSIAVLPELLDQLIAGATHKSHTADTSASTSKRRVVRLWVVQDPTMQRRSLLSFIRHAQLSAAPQYTWAIATVETNAARDGHQLDAAANARVIFGYSLQRLVSLVVGEHQRLGSGPESYGPCGKHFIADGGDIPSEVDAAFETIKLSHNVLGRISTIN